MTGQVLVVLSVLAVALVLMAGLYTLWIGGETGRNWSNRLMRIRVLAQFIAILDHHVGALLQFALRARATKNLEPHAVLMLIPALEPSTGHYDKPFKHTAHAVRQDLGEPPRPRKAPGEASVLYIDRHLVHEVTSAQAFEGLRETGRKARRPGADARGRRPQRADDRPQARHRDPESALSVQTLENNAREFGIEFFGMNDIRQGIVHIIGPEQGWTLPGLTIVCGDSHTATHGAFGALAFGIGTSEVEHVLATQTLLTTRSKNMRVNVERHASRSASRRRTSSSRSSARSARPAARAMSSNMPATRSARSRMEGRMTVCNMSIEGGARAGLIAADDTTFDYLRGRPRAPKGAEWEGRSTIGAR